MRIERAKLPSRAERTRYRLGITPPNRIQLHNTYEHKKKKKKRAQTDSLPVIRFRPWGATPTQSIPCDGTVPTITYQVLFPHPVARPPAYSARKRFLDLTMYLRTYICRYLDRYNKCVRHETAASRCNAM